MNAVAVVKSQSFLSEVSVCTQPHTESYVKKITCLTVATEGSSVTLKYLILVDNTRCRIAHSRLHASPNINNRKAMTGANVAVME